MRFSFVLIGVASLVSSSEQTFDLLFASALLKSESKSNGGFLLVIFGGVVSVGALGMLTCFVALALLPLPLLTGFKRTLHNASAEIPRQSDFEGSGDAERCGTAADTLG